MIEMLKTRKEQLQEQGKKGFTLMEMLIVIAIIAILIAIAIPLFTSQLNAARDAADEANGRALFAALTADKMLGDVDAVTGSGTSTITYGGTTYTFNGSAAVDTTGDVPSVTVTLHDGSTVTFPAGATS